MYIRAKMKEETRLSGKISLDPQTTRILEEFMKEQKLELLAMGISKPVDLVRASIFSWPFLRKWLLENRDRIGQLK